MSNLTQSLGEMAAVAQAYCRLIDSTRQGTGDWLEQLFRLMPRLHAAVTALNAFDNAELPASHVDLDERFELYSHLRRLLGSRDSYWLEFDPDSDAAAMSSSR